MAINFPEGTQNYPSYVTDFSSVQRGGEESWAFNAGNTYVRTNYTVTVDVNGSSNYVYLIANISCSPTIDANEWGWRWAYRSGTSGTWNVLTGNGAVGDALNGRQGYVTGQHNDNERAEFGRSYNMATTWATGLSAGTWQFAPQFHNVGSNMTMYINRFAWQDPNVTWDRRASSTVSAFVLDI